MLVNVEKFSHVTKLNQEFIKNVISITNMMHGSNHNR